MLFTLHKVMIAHHIEQIISTDDLEETDQATSSTPPARPAKLGTFASPRLKEGVNGESLFPSRLWQSPIHQVTVRVCVLRKNEIRELAPRHGRPYTRSVRQGKVCRSRPLHVVLLTSAPCGV